jgi:hypothetical protein
LATSFTYTNNKPYLLKQPRMKRNDLAIITLVLIISSITAWNSRYVLIPTPHGYSWYTDHKIAILLPDDLYIWELPVHTDGSVILDGSKSISEETGIVGWNERNSNNLRPRPTGNWQESSVIWLKTEPPQDLRPHLYYNQLQTYATRNHMEINITKGEIHTFTHRNHQGKLQYCNYTLQTTSTGERLQNYGIVACYYCEKTQRTIELFYIDIYDSDPKYDQEKIYNDFKFILDSLRCH